MSGPAFAAVTETHISVIFFLGDLAYKLKKPVQFPFVDLTDRATREALCQREVDLNARLAPDVYLGVAHLEAPDGGEREPMVVMRRMPEDRRLSLLVAAEDPDVPAALDDLAVLVARFHAAAERSPTIDVAGSVEGIAGLWDENFAELRPFRGAGLDAEAFDKAEQRSRSFIAGRASLFAARVAEGMICDGHGDLQTDDVFCLPDGPRALDCIEFNDEFRYGDVADDVAFLVMDLERLGAPGAARRFVAGYEAAAGAAIPPALLHFYVAYRAQVRAKVACLRAAQRAADDPDRDADLARAGQLLRLCVEHLDVAVPRVVLVGGLPGTGKSTVAAALGETLAAVVLRSDEVRHRTALPPGEDRYSDAAKAAVYRAMLDEAGAHLAHGRSVVLDAAFLSVAHRDAARHVARASASDCIEIRCVLDPDVAAGRITRRLAEGADPSEATPAVARALAQGQDPWPEASVLPTDGSVADVVARAHVVLAAAAARPGSPEVPEVPAVPAGPAGP